MRAAVLILFCLVGCQSVRVDPATERDALQEVRDRHRAAHLNRDAETLVSTFAGDFRSIQSGQVTLPTYDENVRQFQAYFDRSTFLAWDDVEPPIVHVSADGSMAYVIVEKRVLRRDEAHAAGAPPEESRFAWLETWRKERGEWRLAALASTRQPASGR